VSATAEAADGGGGIATTGDAAVSALFVFLDPAGAGGWAEATAEAADEARGTASTAGAPGYATAGASAEESAEAAEEGFPDCRTLIATEEASVTRSGLCESVNVWGAPSA
jgi:hypothetical protein